MLMQGWRMRAHFHSWRRSRIGRFVDDFIAKHGFRPMLGLSDGEDVACGIVRYLRLHNLVAARL
jgi:hypothetical protein